MEKKYEKDIDLLVEAIGDKASRDEIEKEFEKFVVDFKIESKEAMRAIAKKYDISLGDMGDVDMTISELESGQNNVTILARITFVVEKEITAKGEKKQIISGFLADNTGSCAFTVWEKGDLTLEKGDVIRIESAYTTEYRDEVQINAGNRSIINMESKDALPPLKGGNGGGPPKETKDVKISDIVTKADFDVNLLARIVFVNEKEITARGEQKVILSGILGDETGTIPFTIWEKGDLSLEKGGVIKIGGAYITEWREQPQVNVGNRGIVEMGNKDDVPEVKAGGGGAPKETKDVKVSDIGPKADFDVNLLARIVFVNEKEITAQGETKTIISGILGDETGTIPFTIWEIGDLALEKGDVIKIEAAYITEWREEPQINVGSRGTVEMGDKDAVSEVKRGPRGPGRDVKISEIKDGDRNINVLARILIREEKEVMIKEEMKTLVSGTIADETGKISYTCWGKAKMKIGDVIQINNGYIRSFRNMPQLNFDPDSVDKSKEKLPSAKVLSKPVSSNILGLVNSGGMLDAQVDGMVLDVRDGSGLIFRCPECNRAIKKNICKIHEKVEGIPDMRVKAVLDDGTGAMTAVIGKELSEKLIGKSLDDCLEEATDAMDFSIIQDQFSELMLARPVRAIGSVSLDDFGLFMIVNEIEFLKLDVENEARALMEVLE